jgi:dipeptidyl aminopeptidase/acylaminoacyl peptidase
VLVVAAPAAARAPAQSLIEVRDGDLMLADERVTGGPAIDAAPDWSPDGRRIAFSRQAPGRRGAAR